MLPVALPAHVLCSQKKMDEIGLNDEAKQKVLQQSMKLENEHLRSQRNKMTVDAFE